MRRFKTEKEALTWLATIAEDCSEYHYNLRIGYADSDITMKRYNKKRSTGNKTHNYSIDEVVLVGDRRAHIGCDLDTHIYGVEPRAMDKERIVGRA